jgi:hypothetical protein
MFMYCCCDRAGQLGESGSLIFYELEGFMDMMSRCYMHCCCDRAGQLGKSGSLRREGWREGCRYSEVPRW